METSLSVKAQNFIARAKENPEVSAGLASLSEGTYGLLNSGGTVILGIFNILKGTIKTATRSEPEQTDSSFDYNLRMVRQNPLTGEWNMVETGDVV
jgi:hypothetical protein